MNKLSNMNQLLGMAQNMAKNMDEQMQALRVEGNAGGGMVTVVMNGHKQVQSISISHEVVNPQDVEMLQDLIVAALCDAQSKVDEKMKENLGPLAGKLPGGFPFGGL